MKILYTIGIVVCFSLASYAIKSIYIIGNAFMEGNVYDKDITFFIIKLLLYIAGVIYLAITTIKLFREIKGPIKADKT